MCKGFYSPLGRDYTLWRPTRPVRRVFKACMLLRPRHCHGHTAHAKACNPQGQSASPWARNHGQGSPMGTLLWRSFALLVLGSVHIMTYLHLGSCMPQPWLHTMGLPWPLILFALINEACPRRALALAVACLSLGSVPMATCLGLGCMPIGAAACHDLGCMPIWVTLALATCPWAT